MSATGDNTDKVFKLEMSVHQKVSLGERKGKPQMGEDVCSTYHWQTLISKYKKSQELIWRHFLFTNE